MAGGICAFGYQAPATAVDRRGTEPEAVDATQPGGNQSRQIKPTPGNPYPVAPEQRVNLNAPKAPDDPGEGTDFDLVAGFETLYANGRRPVFGKTAIPAALWERRKETIRTEGGDQEITVIASTGPASKALDLFINVSPQYDCRTALGLAVYQAIRLRLGDEAFDRVMSELGGVKLPFGQGDRNPLDALLVTERVPRSRASSLPPNQIVRFENDLRYGALVDLPEFAPLDGGWRGEWAVTAGGGVFWGHPFPKAYASDIDKELARGWTEIRRRAALANVVLPEKPDFPDTVAVYSLRTDALDRLYEQADIRQGRK